MVSLNSDHENKQDFDEKIEYNNEYVLKPGKGFINIVNYFLYFPVNFILIILFKDIHKVEN